MSKTDNRIWLTIIGIGEQGWDGLSDTARQAILAADTVIGGARHQSLIPDSIKNYEAWPSPMKLLAEKIPGRSDENICVLASGNPLFYGIGAHLASVVPHDQMQIIPHMSAFTHICAHMKWSEPDTTCITACGRPVENLHRALFDQARIVLYSAGPETPHDAARLLTRRGFGASLLTIFEHAGGPNERRSQIRADALTEELQFKALNSTAISCRAGSGADQFSTMPGLADSAYRSDGQITRRDIRASVLARLCPRPAELLWDIGAGSGSIGIEWMRAAHEARAFCIEMNLERSANIRHNATEMGVPRLKIIEGAAPQALEGLEPPDAIFIGGGITTSAMTESCWTALKPGGRLAATSVTLEAEAVLTGLQRKYGGELIRISIEYAEPLGGFTGWKPARPIVLHSVTKPTED